MVKEKTIKMINNFMHNNFSRSFTSVATITIMLLSGHGAYAVNDVPFELASRVVLGATQTFVGFTSDEYSGTTSFNPPKLLLAGDFSGDSRSEIVSIFYDNGYMSADVMLSRNDHFDEARWAVKQGEYTNSQTWYASDFNGDGKTDLAKFWRDGDFWSADVHVSNGSGFEKQRWATQIGTMECEPSNVEPPVWDGAVRLSGVLATGEQGVSALPDCGASGWYLGDFNGDGKSDFVKLWIVDGSWRVDVFESTGTEFKSRNVFSTIEIMPGVKNWGTGDFNGDGKTDLAKFSNSQGYWSATVLIADGENYNPASWLDEEVKFVSGQRPVVTDVDGDGKSDIFMTWTDTQQRNSILFSSSGSKFDVVQLDPLLVTLELSEEWRIGNFIDSKGTQFVRYWNDLGKWSANVYTLNNNKFEEKRWATAKEDYYHVSGCKTTNTDVVAGNNQGRLQLSGVIGSCGGNSYHGLRAVLDTNADGRDDIVHTWHDGEKWNSKVHLSTGYSYVETQGQVVAPILIAINGLLLY